MQHLLNVEADQPLQRFSILLDQTQSLRSELDHAYESARKDPFSARNALATAVDLLDQLDELRADVGETLLKLVFSGDAAKAAQILTRYGELDVRVPLEQPTSPGEPISEWIDQVAHSELAVVLDDAPPKGEESIEVSSVNVAVEPTSETNEEAFQAVLPCEPVKKRPSIATVARTAEPSSIAPISIEVFAKRAPEVLAEVVELGTRKASNAMLNEFLNRGIGAHQELSDEIPQHLLRLSFEDETSLELALNHCLAITASLRDTPKSYSSPLGVGWLLDRVAEVFSQTSLEHLSNLGGKLHQRTLSAWVAWLCHARELVDQSFLGVDSFDAEYRLDQAFREATRNSNEVYSGHVYGLKRGCEVPEGFDSWFSYMQHCIDEAVDAIELRIKSRADRQVSKPQHDRVSLERKAKNRTTLPAFPAAIADRPLETTDDLELVKKFVQTLLQASQDQKASDRAAWTKRAAPIAKQAWIKVRQSEFADHLLYPPMQELLALIHHSDPDFEPERWVHWDLTRGKRMLVLGGLRVEDEIQEIKRFFGLEAVEWEPHRGTEGYSRIHGRMESLSAGAWDFAACTIKSSGHTLTNMIQSAISGSKTTKRIDVDGFRVNSFAVALCRAFSLNLTTDGFIPTLAELNLPVTEEAAPSTSGEELLADPASYVCEIGLSQVLESESNTIQTSRCESSAIEPPRATSSEDSAAATRQGVTENLAVVLHELRFVLAKLDLRIPGDLSKVRDLEKFGGLVADAASSEVRGKLMQGPELMQAEYADCLAGLSRLIHFAQLSTKAKNAREQAILEEIESVHALIDSFVEDIPDLLEGTLDPSAGGSKLRDAIASRREGWRKIVHSMEERLHEFSSLEELRAAMDTERLEAFTVSAAAFEMASPEPKVEEQSPDERADSLASEEVDSMNSTDETISADSDDTAVTMVASEVLESQNTTDSGEEDKSTMGLEDTKVLIAALSSAHSREFQEYFNQDTLLPKAMASGLLIETRKTSTLLREKQVPIKQATVNALVSHVDKVARVLRTAQGQGAQLPYFTLLSKLYVQSIDLRRIASAHMMSMKRPIARLAGNAKDILNHETPIGEGLNPAAFSPEIALRLMGTYLREVVRRHEKMGI